MTSDTLPDSSTTAPTIDRPPEALRLGERSVYIGGDASHNLIFTGDVIYNAVPGQGGKHENIQQVVAKVLASLKKPDSHSAASAPLTSNLPAEVTPIVGRERDIAAVRDRLKTARLLTLTGSGGVGKTRLAIAVGSLCADEMPDGVWLARLGPIRTPGMLVPTLTSLFGLSDSADQPGLAVLTDHLRGKSTLLILDNCEQIRSECEMLVSALLEGCPQLRILATSRELLSVGDRAQYIVKPLTCPVDTALTTVDAVAASDAVRLFVMRAQSVAPEFKLNADTAGPVAQICRRLDGLPLALELAAALIRTSSANELNQMLVERFELLTDGDSTALPHHRALWDLIDWSYNLLTDSEKTILRQLAVLTGGWDRQAAIGICRLDDSGEARPTTIVRALTQLVDKSLVASEDRQGTFRFSLLESVREYALVHLRKDSTYENARRRHLKYFHDLVARAIPELSGARQTVCLEMLRTEQDNLRAALAFGSECWSLASQDRSKHVPSGDVGISALDGMKLAGSLWRFWEIQGEIGEGRRWLGKFIASKNTVRGEDLADGRMSFRAEGNSGSPDSQTSDPGFAAANALVLNAAGNLARSQGDYQEARAQLEQSLATRRTLGDAKLVAQSLNNLGIVLMSLGDWDGARRLYEESLSIKRGLGDKWGSAQSLNNLALLSLRQRDFETGCRLLQECRDIREELGDKEGLAQTLCNLAIAGLQMEKPLEAQEHLRTSLELFTELGHKPGLAACLEAAAATTSATGNWDYAIWLLGAARAIRERFEIRLTSREQEEHDNLLAQCRAALTTETADKLFRHGMQASAEAVFSVIVQFDAASIQPIVEKLISLAAPGAPTDGVVQTP